MARDEEVDYMDALLIRRGGGARRFRIASVAKQHVQMVEGDEYLCYPNLALKLLAARGARLGSTWGVASLINYEVQHTDLNSC